METQNVKDTVKQIFTEYLNIPIAVSAAVNQKHLFTGSINCGDSITRVIERICFNMGCSYKYENEKITIY